MEGKGGLNIADFAGMIDGAIKRIINHLGDIPFIGVPSNPVDFDLMEENIHIIETATTGMRVVIRGMKLSQGLASPGEEGPANDLEEIIAKQELKGAFEKTGEAGKGIETETREGNEQEGGRVNF